MIKAVLIKLENGYDGPELDIGSPEEADQFIRDALEPPGVVPGPAEQVLLGVGVHPKGFNLGVVEVELAGTLDFMACIETGVEGQVFVEPE